MISTVVLSIHSSPLVLSNSVCRRHHPIDAIRSGLFSMSKSERAGLAMIVFTLSATGSLVPDVTALQPLTVLVG